MKMKRAGKKKALLRRLQGVMPECWAQAEVIRMERNLRRWPLAKLAEKSGVSRQMLSYIETVERVPSFDKLVRIARAYEMSTCKLVKRGELWLAHKWERHGQGWMPQ